MRTYRHAPNVGSRKSWAAGDATARAVRLAMMALTGEMGIPTVLSVSRWGFIDVCLKGRPLVLKQTFGTYVMENILFKISYPAEFHAQTAVECAVQLHPQVEDRWHLIDKIAIQTHESAIRIISKTGKLDNAADRDHCLQSMVAVGLIAGDLQAHHYEDDYHHKTPLVDELSAKMQIEENLNYSKDYLDPQKRSIANAMQIFFLDGTHTPMIAIEYPLGHRKRRSAGIPILELKFNKAMQEMFHGQKASKIVKLMSNQTVLEAVPANAFMELLIPDEEN